MLLFFVGWLIGWLLLARLRACAPNESKRSREVTIIIPARDEEENLGRLLQSIAQQSFPAREVIVVDDCSSDRTAEVARSARARVIAGTPPPSGWRGKTWACEQGAREAKSELLLFLDADTWFAPDGLRRMVSEFTSGALSVAPYHVVPSLREQFSAFFNLVVLAGSGAFTLLSDRLPARGLLGQCMLIERDTYNRVGGHGAVREHVLENFALGNKLRAIGETVRCRAGRDAVYIRMYSRSWPELIDGWSKGFASGAVQTAPWLLLLIIAWLAALTFSVIHLSPVAYLLSAFQIAWLLRRIGSFNFLTAILFPFPLLFFFAVFTRATLVRRGRREVRWKGRSVGVA